MTPSRDPVDWFNDLSVHIDDEDLLEQAASLEPALLHGPSRIGTAVWTMLVSWIAGGLGGFTFSDEVRSAWLIFGSYLIVAALALRMLKPLTVRLLGPTITFQVGLAFFWSVLLAIVAVLGGRVETGWLFYVVTVGGGLFIGLMYGSTNPYVGNEDALPGLLGLPLGALATWSAATVQRGFDASTNPSWSEVFVGTMAASVFMVPMAVLTAMLSTRARALAKMATLYLHNENFTAKAIEYLDQAVALSPKSADLRNLRGIAYSKLGDAERADADFRTVSELMPRAAEAHMNRGVDFIRQGDYERAIEALKLATTIKPRHATAFSNLGTAYQKKGDLDAAIESYTRAIELRAKYPIAWANRAYSHHLKGDYDLAIADATHAITLDSRLPMAHVNLGHALAGKGDVRGAARSYRHALAMNPDPSVAEEALEALDKLGVHPDDDDEDHDDR